jgi:uncharacterized membrane-anchored protein
MLGATDAEHSSLGIGYVGGSFLLFSLLIALLGLWRISFGSVSVDHITSPRVELLYWVTILFSNTLGTALGDFLADASGLGYEGGAIVFSAALALVAAVYAFTRRRAIKIAQTWLFWMAFILTRPLGATGGDLLTKAHEHGGFNLSRISSSAAIAFFIVFCILLTSQRTVH